MAQLSTADAKLSYFFYVQRCPRVTSTAGRVGRVEFYINSLFCLLENLSAYSDQNSGIQIHN